MEFDVFLSYNSKDKPAVRDLVRLLKAEGIRVWVDEEQLVPGRNWQPLLLQGIGRSEAASVLVGGDGLGPWENEEMQVLLRRAVSAHKPVIPVLLPGAAEEPELPLFLENRTWVDLRSGLTQQGIDKLVWGISEKRPGRSEPAHEYAVEGDNPLVKIFDHTIQLGSIAGLLRAPGSDRIFALVEACAEDWPSFLADHLYLDPWPDAPSVASGATLLGELSGSDKEEFWRALVKTVPGANSAKDETARRAVVRGWINGTALCVLYVTVKLGRSRRLPRIVRDADATLAGLGAFAPGIRVLVLIACMPESDRVPIWWPWYVRLRLRRLERFRRLDRLRMLDKPDIEGWYAGFPQALLPYYNRDQLKAELIDLFKRGRGRRDKRDEEAPDRPGIRYEEARRRLIDEGALRRARLRP